MSIISVNNLTYYYDGCDEAVYENVSFTLDTTWKTGLIGRNGRGKTTLLKLLTGELENGGAVNTKAEFLYFPFDVEDKNMSGSELIGIICPEVQEWEVIRELSYMGASVLHEAAIFPVRSAKIPINIRNTNDPSAKGTMIVAEDNEPPQHIITGIAGKKHFSVISIEKDEMNSEIGFLRRILTVLEANGMCFEHIPTGIDTMSIIVDGKDVDKTPDIVEKICEVTDPNHIEIENDLALIAIVGRGMKSKKGTATRIFAALSHADINIKMIDQGSSELNIIVGIHEADFEKAIKVIYDMFILSED